MSVWTAAASATLTGSLSVKQTWPKMLTFLERKGQSCRVLAASAWGPHFPAASWGSTEVRGGQLIVCAFVLGLAVGGWGSGALPVTGLLWLPPFPL